MWFYRIEVENYEVARTQRSIEYFQWTTCLLLTKIKNERCRTMPVFRTASYSLCSMMLQIDLCEKRVVVILVSPFYYQVKQRVLLFIGWLYSWSLFRNQFQNQQNFIEFLRTARKLVTLCNLFLVLCLCLLLFLVLCLCLWLSAFWFVSISRDIFVLWLCEKNR